MSRTSRRVSRPLIAVLAVVIILGAVFTIHKLKSAPAAEAKVAAPAQSTPRASRGRLIRRLRRLRVTPAPLVAAKPAPPTTEPSHVVEPSHIIAPAPAPDSDALVTQTPTVMSPRPSTQPSGSAHCPQSPPHRPAPNCRICRTTAANLQAQFRQHQHHPLRFPGPKPTPPLPPPATPSSEISNQPLQDARTKADAGDLIASRQLLNDALITGRLSDADADAAKKQIEDINKILVFSAKRFPNDPWGGVYQVASGERLATIAARNSVTWELLSRVNGVTPRRLRSGQNIKIFKGPFHAVVYKGLFKMEIYLGAPGGPGSLYITSFPVGLGKDNSTPTGLWLCKNGDKIRNPRY